MTLVQFFVAGRPVSKGSMRHVGRGRMVEQIRDSAPWRERVHWAARQAYSGLAIGGPVSAMVTFYFDWPKSHWRTGTNAHLLRDNAPAWPSNRASGDIDKLVRNVLDAITGVVICDDSQVVSILALKRWAGYGRVMAGPGADIAVRDQER